MLLYFQLIASLAWSLAAAQPDVNRIDLSVYKLRQVDTRQMALQRAHKPISDLVTGAEHMCESLYTSSPQVRCSAYAHLFRLIKSVHGHEGRIKQATVEALAVAVTNERSFYFDLLTRQPDYLSAASKHFIEAIEGLEHGQLLETNAYLDLMGCLRDVMLQGTPEVSKFLAQPVRAKRLAQVAHFKAIHPEATPTGMVDGLADRIERGKLAKLSSQDFRQASELIESLDDQVVAAYRQANGIHEQSQRPEELSGWSQGQGQPSPSPSSATPPSPLDLVVPVEQKANADGRSFDLSRLAILKFIKMRLEQRPYSRWYKPVKLSMRLAFDFRSHWQDLVAYKPISSDKLAQLALEFREDPKNVQLARRVEQAINTYEHLVRLLGTMQDQHLESLEELERPLNELGKLLTNIDASFDVDDIRRLNEIWLAKFREYTTMDKFINGDFW